MNILLLILILILFVIRPLRWLAILQQKEYRLDRLWAFFRSIEGKKELKSLLNIPKPAKSSIKRPLVTPRILVVITVYIFTTLIQLFFIYFIYELCIIYQLSDNYARIVALTLIYLTYLFTPFTVWLSAVPTNIIAIIITHQTLKKAQKLIQKHHPVIIGITGSYGKTSTKLILDQLLKSKYRIFTTPKSFNTRYSIAKSIVENYQGEQYAILEYGAYTKGEIKHLTKWFPPDLAIITGVTSQHLELFGSIDNIINAKSELIKALPENAPVFINGFDHDTLKVVKAAQRDTYIDCSQPIEATYEFHSKKHKKPTAIISFSTDEKGYIALNLTDDSYKTQIVGTHYKENIMTAFHVAIHLGITMQDCLNALKDFHPPSQFIKSHQSESGVQIIDDGKTSNPIGFEAVIATAKTIKSHHKVLLTSGIIDLGSESKQIHKKLAEKAGKIFQKIYYVGIDGQEQFKTVCGGKCITDVNVVKKELKLLPSKSLIIIEGLIKKDILDTLK